MHGEPARLYWRRRKVRLRPLILILDVSGSMADYSRSLLQFAHSAARSAGRVEVFCFGTRLTRVTGAMECRRPDEALERAARAAFDWDGGTRIGDSLDAFVRGWARRGLCRGGIVVICSDGLDRGDPAVLAVGAGAAVPAQSPAGLAEPAQGRRSRLPAQHARDDDRGPAHRPAAVRARPEQPGEARYSAANAWLTKGRWERAVRWSVGIEAEAGAVLTREQVVELADAVAATAASRAGSVPAGTARA